MPHTRYPNLFIVGAPKCGTTALSHYLAGHPQVFMSETAGIKEPYHFASDLGFTHFGPMIYDESAYLRLFDDAPPSARYRGKASAGYLLSRQAISHIVRQCEDPRFIVMLRNPVDLAHSLHNEHVKSFGEFPDFETCWQRQAARLEGRNLPPRFRNGAALQYGDMAKIGAQFERMLGCVDPRHVHVILYDDFSTDTAGTYAAVLDWLGLAHDGRTEFEKLNPSITYQWPRLEHALRKIRTLRRALRLPGGLGIHAWIDRHNKRLMREPLRPPFRRQLCDYFRDDVALLSRLLGRDLSHWLN